MDKKEGKWTVWYVKGGKEKEAHWENNLLHGKYREWYKNGQMRLNGFYKAGIKTGKWEYWYQDGTKRLEDLYENSKKIYGKNNLIGDIIKSF